MGLSRSRGDGAGNGGAEQVGRGISKWQCADLGFSVKGAIMEKWSPTRSIGY